MSLAREDNMHLHCIIPNPLVKSALVLTIAMSTVAWLTDFVMRTADALPAGFFFLQATVQDNFGAHAFGVMDVENADRMVTGLVQLNAPNNRPSQLWKERLPIHGTIDVIKLENKATGQCLADSTDHSDILTIRPCNDELTLWQKIPQGSADKVVFRKTTRVTGPFPDIHVCLMKDSRLPGVVVVLTCNGDTFPSEMVWNATSQPLGTVSSGSTPDSPPPSPPLRPTGCTVFGTGGVCGLVGFNCNPLSAADTIVVRSGAIGVGVTSVEPRIGLINGTYLNEGQAAVAVCARRAGMTSCADPIDVTFGPTLCPSPPPGRGRTCPTGEIPCGSGCGRPSDPECHLK
jgi:hypothetical protein